jgi:D-alanyl-D-alanine carboxypeptidase
MANLELDVPMARDNLLAAGSITKSFTAAAILVLVQRGDLSLDDDVRKYLPDIVAFEAPITIEQLLTHTSGFPNVVDREDFDAISKMELSVSELLSLTNGMPQHFPPGSGYRYSDSGYFLLGAVIESLSGLTYERFVEEQIFGPAGLEHTTYGSERKIIPGRVPGYSKEGDAFINAPHIDMTIPYAAGGVYSTAEDLANWIKVLNGGEFIDPGLLERAWATRTLPDGTAVAYGYGWNICDIAGQRSIGHGGFINGFSASLEYLPVSDITVAVLTNQDAGEPEASYLTRRILRLMLTGNAVLQELQLDASKRNALVGTYRYENGDSRVIFDNDGYLYSRRNDNDPIRLVALSPEFLAFPDTEGTYGLRFTSDSDGAGRIVETRLNCNIQEIARRETD